MKYFFIMPSLIIFMFFSISCTEKKTVITGEVDATEIDVGVKMPGRLARILVHEGEIVKKDQELGFLESKELEAKLQTAEAAYNESQKQFDFANSTYERINNLYKQGVVPKQQYEETKYKFEAAKQKIQATSGQLNEVKAYNSEMFLKAPLDGEVVQIVSHGGEIVSPGYPVVTILDLQDQWVTFNVREDKLEKIHKDLEVEVFFPALKKNFIFKITYISALGNFAKWKATNDQGSFDLKTFEVRARTQKPIEQLRPGMTAIVTIK